MNYEDLHARYGAHVATRIQDELPAEEFKQVKIEELQTFLEKRAEAAHREYQTRLENPFINEELGNARADYIDVLYKRWCDAEDLAYLVAVAENANHQSNGQKRA